MNFDERELDRAPRRVDDAAMHARCRSEDDAMVGVLLGSGGQLEPLRDDESWLEEEEAGEVLRRALDREAAVGRGRRESVVRGARSVERADLPRAVEPLDDERWHHEHSRDGSAGRIDDDARREGNRFLRTVRRRRRFGRRSVAVRLGRDGRARALGLPRGRRLR